MVAAAKWLVKNSQLYQDEGVTVEDTWTDSFQELENDWEEFIDSEEPDVGSENLLQPQEHTTVASVQQTEVELDSHEEWTEIQSQDIQATGTLDTMLTPNFEDDNLAYCFAPSEGNCPLGLFQDKYSEELAFPTLFSGHSRNKTQLKAHYSNICKWE